ncbi:lipopolysaccharide biosynthesis protein [Aurantiacibacter hainanensis]|uniref:lipopolysaccharide biosynthesis protein n=1 Tax=Aurantiacibacter hainanensis TaxID=3076114 RepID=UPI0030C73604
MTPEEITRLSPAKAEGNIFLSRLGSIAHLLTGSFAVAAVMALSTVVAARALGPEAYGVLALVLTIGRICERFIRFESWQPIIRFGTQTDIEENPEAMGRLFLLGLLLDIGCALLAAAVMLIGGFFILPYIGLEQSDFYLLAIFAPAIALNISGVPTAALRLAGQFKLLAYFQLFSAVLRLIMAGIAWAMDAPLPIFLAIWTLAQIINTVVFGLLAARAFKNLGIANPLRAEVKGLLARFPGFMGFAWSTNASSALRTLTHELDTLLVGAFAGPVAAGSYHIAKRFAKVAQQVAAHVQAVIYPDMSRMWARNRQSEVRSIKAKIQLGLGGVGLAATLGVVAVGKPGIEFLFGEGFDLVYPLLVTQLIAVTCIMIGAPTRSTMLAMNRPGTVLMIAVLATVVFFATAFIAIPEVGAIGANYAHIGFGLLTVILLEITFRMAYKADQPNPPVQPEGT